MTRGPVYLIASERSGTNLLRRQLTQHNDVYYGPSPAHFLKHLYFNEPFYGDLLNNKNFLSLISDALELCYKHFSPWGIRLTPNCVLDGFEKRIRSAISLADYLMQRYAEHEGYASYFCKDNFIYEFAESIALEIPNAKFIYLYRDPRDVVLSQIKRPNGITGVANAARLWEYEQTRSIRVARDLKKRDRCYFVSYEDLVTRGDIAIREICEFLNVPYLAEEQNVNDNIRVRVHEWENIDSPIIGDNFNKYKSELSSIAISAIERQCYKPMTYLNYSAELPSQKPSVYCRIYLKLQNIYGRLFQRVKRRLIASHRSQNRIMRERSRIINKLYNNYRNP